MPLLLLLLLQKGETQEMKEYNQLRRSEGGWGRRSWSQETTRDRHQIKAKLSNMKQDKD
jgi:hypothetical protein